MLASITPLGERGRRSRWGVTVSAFLLGATLAGARRGRRARAARLAALGTGSAPALGCASSPSDSRSRRRLVLAVVLELPLRRVPGPNRQVNERWLDEFRGWVYGFGFGAQLGLGVHDGRHERRHVRRDARRVPGRAIPAGARSCSACFGAIRGADAAARGACPRAPISCAHSTARFERGGAARSRPASLVCLAGMTRGGDPSGASREAGGARNPRRPPARVERACVQPPGRRRHAARRQLPARRSATASSATAAPGDAAGRDRSSRSPSTGPGRACRAGPGCSPRRGSRRRLDPAAFSVRGLAHPRPGQVGSAALLHRGGAPVLPVRRAGRSAHRRGVASLPRSIMC